MPQRIQLRRAAGWRKPPGAISVARPSRWGNPFRVLQHGRDTEHPGCWFIACPDGMHVGLYALRADAAADAVALYRDEYLDEVEKLRPGTRGQIRADLGGHDLGCWCRPGDPCHADVLLELANDRTP